MFNEYRYNIELRYMYDNTEVVLDSTNISSIVIDYDFDNKNMPTMYAKVNIDKNVLDDMIINSNKKTITVIISKYINNSKVYVKENYIKDRFIYFLPKDINPNKALDYNNATKDAKDIYTQVTIGLMKLDCINNNKVLINTVYKNTNLSNIIASQLSNMNLLMEPLPNAKNIPNFIVPPLNSLSTFISYINQQYVLYDTTYRFFYDYNKTYLISSSGKPIPCKSEIMHSVILDVHETNTDISKMQGINVDYDKKVYFINVDTTEINTFEDQALPRSYNSVMVVSSEGGYEKIKLNTEIPNSKNENIRIEKLNNDNIGVIKNIKSSIENSISGLNITKSELDGSVFTINKEYIIKNYDKLNNNNSSKFLLSRKREIYTLNNDNYSLSCLLTFKKILS